MLRIIFCTSKSSRGTVHFIDVPAESWSCTETLLAIVHLDSVRYYPLKNIESFYQLPEAV